MGLFDVFSSFLTGSVGNNRANDPQDVRSTKRNLWRTGDFNGEVDNDYITRELDTGIRDYQRKNGLKIDGILNPGGETERSLYERINGRSADDAFGKVDEGDGGSVGFGGNVSGILARKAPEKPEYRSSLFASVFANPITETKDSKKQSPWALNVAEKDQEEVKPTKPAADSLEGKPIEYDATGRMIKPKDKKKEVEKNKLISPIPKIKPTFSETRRPSFDIQNAPTVNLKRERIDSLLHDTPARFDIRFKKTSKIIREAAIDTFSRDNEIARKTVDLYTEAVERLAKKHDVDPDLVKAIMWDENARGDKWGLNRLLDPVGSSQRPMNINGQMWSKLIGKLPDRLHDPEENIEASVILIKRISDRIKKPTAGKVASIWNAVGRETTNEFGNDVDIIYNQKPWTRNK